MPSSSIQHLQKLQALLQALADVGIEMESHNYDAASFGNFTLVLGKGHAKARFLWDGKESTLAIKYQRVRNETIGCIWEHDALIEIPASDAVFAEIGSNAEQMLQ